MRALFYDMTMAAGEPATVTESVVIRLERRKHTLPYRAGDTILETARRGGLRPPFSCEQGNCATCMAHLDAGAVTMRANDALTPEEVEEGWVLTCQSIPTTTEVVIDYDI
jgi:3-ketosteroid 9alpha-monooxygenase subunit B